MQTIAFRVTIPENRTLNLELPPDIPAGPAQVVLVVETKNPLSGERDELNIADLGWSQEKAASIRTQLASFVEDWDDPQMDVYNDFPAG